MDRSSATAALKDVSLVPGLEGSLAQARELERQLLAQDIPVLLGKPPAKACCGGGCGCGAKVQLLLREEDLPRLQEILREDWMEAVRREGVLESGGLVPLKLVTDGEPPCPACGHAAPLSQGACADCGLQLE